MLFAGVSGRLLQQQMVGEVERVRHVIQIALLMAGCALSGVTAAASVYVKALGFDNAEVMINGGEKSLSILFRR